MEEIQPKKQDFLKYPILDDRYVLLDTLGSGSFSQVKLAIDLKDGSKYAVKIFKLTLKQANVAENQAGGFFLKSFHSEIQTLKTLKHPNLIKLIAFSDQGKIVHIKGSTKKEVSNVIYLLLELAVGGELFDYVALGGRFTEPVARYYFKQLISGLAFIHQSGFSHRDLKPENIFLDEDYNLKIADFGFASQISKNEGYLLRTRLGTENYMAPEILLGKPYCGPSIDLFSAGIILFIMVAKTPPFFKAYPTDTIYKLIVENRDDLFWIAHSKNKPDPASFFSEEFKQLITGLLQYEPGLRYSLADVISCPWYCNNNVPTQEEIINEFKLRRQIIQDDHTMKKLKALQDKNQQSPRFLITLPSPENKKLKAGCAQLQGTKFKAKSPTHERLLHIYDPLVNRSTEVMTQTEIGPLGILNFIVNTLMHSGQFDLKLSNSDYKMKVESQNTELPQKNVIEIKILKVINPEYWSVATLATSNESNQQYYCIRFTRMEGDCLSFNSAFEQIKKIIFKV